MIGACFVDPQRFRLDLRTLHNEGRHACTQVTRHLGNSARHLRVVPAKCGVFLHDQYAVARLESGAIDQHIAAAGGKIGRNSHVTASSFR